MKDNLKIKAVLGDDTATMVSELHVLLNEELTRPIDQRDFDYIAELTQSIAELSGASLTDEEQEVNISAIISEASAVKKRSLISVVRRTLSVACSFALIFAAANCISFASFGSDVFHAFVDYKSGGFVVDFANTDPEKGRIPTAQAATAVMNGTQAATAGPSTGAPSYVTRPDAGTGVATDAPTEGVTEADAVSEPLTKAMTSADPIPVVPEGTEPEADHQNNNGGSENPIVSNNDGSYKGVKTAIGTIIRNRCADAGVNAVAPPDDFFLNMELEDYSTVEMENSRDFYFTFSNNSQQLDIILEHYPSRYKMPELKIPSDQNGFRQETFDVGTVYFFEDNDVNTALFVNNDTIYTVIIQNADMDVLYKIIAVFGSRN